MVQRDGVRGVFPVNEEVVLDELEGWGAQVVGISEFDG